MTHSHETIAIRLVDILQMLNEGGKLVPADLADKFHVSLRTIQRDLKVRFAYLDLEKKDGCYYIDPSLLGKLSPENIDRFASLAGVHGLFPSLNKDFLRDIFDQSLQSSFLVKGHYYEDMSGKEILFREIEKAVVAHCCISFNYLKHDNSEKRYSEVEPYKLLNNKGIWYLAARHDSKLKTFAFSRLRQLHVKMQHFAPNLEILKQIGLEDGIWMNEEKTEVVIKVNREVAGYFKRRKLIANQVIEKELEDGGLIISALVGHPNQVVPIVRYWIPHLRIISPDGLQSEMETQLSNYVQTRITTNKLKA